MKNFFKYASLLAAAVMLFSCHGYYDPNDPANGGSGGPVDDGVLRIKSDKNLIQTFGGDYASLTVTLGSKVITEGVTFFDLLVLLIVHLHYHVDWLISVVAFR